MQQSWSFVAMEYYAIILNRTYLLTVDEDRMEGQVCRGITSVVGGADPLTRRITSALAVHGDLDDPSAYVDREILDQSHQANFSVLLKEVRSVVYNPRRKWGMGYYPHDGRVVVTTDDSNHELIILGTQSGRQIAEQLEAAALRANNSFKPKPLRGSA